MAARKTTSSTRGHSTKQTNNDSRGDHRIMAMDARDLTLPALSIIALIIAFVWGTWMVNDERNRIDNRINEVVTSVERLAKSVELLAVQTKVGTYNRWSSTDQKIWCLMAEKKNNGWECPVVAPMADLPPSVIPKDLIDLDDNK